MTRAGTDSADRVLSTWCPSAQPCTGGATAGRDSSVTSVRMAQGRVEDVGVSVRNRRARVAVGGAVPDQRGAVRQPATPLSRDQGGSGAVQRPLRRGDRGVLGRCAVRRSRCGRTHPPIPVLACRGRGQHRHRGVRLRRRAGAVGVRARRGAVHRGRVRRVHRRRAERPCVAAAAKLRALDHQLAARGVVGGRGARRCDGCRRDRVGHSTHDTPCRVGGAFQRRGAGRVSVSAPRPRRGRSPLGTCEGRGAAGLRRLRDAHARWSSSPSRGRWSRMPEVLGPLCICATASARPARWRCSATSRWSASSSSAG